MYESPPLVRSVPCIFSWSARTDVVSPPNEANNGSGRLIISRTLWIILDFIFNFDCWACRVLGSLLSYPLARKGRRRLQPGICRDEEYSLMVACDPAAAICIKC